MTNIEYYRQCIAKIEEAIQSGKTMDSLFIMARTGEEIASSEFGISYQELGYLEVLLSHVKMGLVLKSREMTTREGQLNDGVQ